VTGWDGVSREAPSVQGVTAAAVSGIAREDPRLTLAWGSGA